MEQGFILTAHSFDNKGRCEIHLYGTGENGPFQVIITPHRPLFFIRRETPQEDLPANLGDSMERRELELSALDDSPVDGLYFSSLNSFFDARRFFQDPPLRLYESDVRAEDRFLMERHINGGIAIEGTCQRRGNLNVYFNPKVSPAEYRPALTQLSLDIETGTDGTVYSIAIHQVGPRGEIKKVLMRGAPGGDGPSRSDLPPGWLCYIPDEKELIKQFLQDLSAFDPDLIVGWHVIGFDLKFLAARAEIHGLPFKIGRGYRTVKIHENRNGLYSADMEGRLVIDGPPTLRTAFFKFENYKLETVAQELLGRGKDITPEKDKVAEIERRFREDKEALGYYNLEDCLLVTEIYEETAIIEQLVTRSLITGLQISKLNMSVAAFDHFMLPAFHRKGYVAPDIADIFAQGHAAGGWVFTSDPGLYPHVVILDFKSLYPTIMRTFFIDPYSRLKSEVDGVDTPAGISFSRTENVLPEFLKELMDKRAVAKKNNDPNLSQAVKILMNSFYGVMGTTGCRFYHPDLPTAITGTGQWLLKTCTAYLRDLGYNALYGDTDSVFVCLKESEWSRTNEAGQALADRVNHYIADLIKTEYGVESRLELEFEKHYDKFFLPSMRYSNEGARKRYAGRQDDGIIEYKGLETVRSDWTNLAKEFQQELFQRFFEEEDLTLWIREYVERLKNGEFDDKLVYKKRLSRGAEEYTKTKPPHVKAALRLDPEGVRKLKEISYIMTDGGPTPVQHFQGRVDYKHYIEKQIRPVADGVLFALGDDFDSLLEGRQLDLF